MNSYQRTLQLLTPLLFCLQVTALASPVVPNSHGSQAVLTANADRCTEFHPQKKPFFGDLHVHSALSLDAMPSRSWTDVLTGRPAPGKPAGLLQPVLPHDVYHYAKGHKSSLELLGGPRDRPLDFVALTDHSEFFAQTNICYKLVGTDERPFLRAILGNTPYCKIVRSRETHPNQQPLIFGFSLSMLYSMASIFTPQNMGTSLVLNFCALSKRFCEKEQTNVWEFAQKEANLANDSTPACQFSAFNAYEWTGTPLTTNLHRNIIFRGEAVVPQVVSYLNADAPSKLWTAVDSQCDKSKGCEWLSIPHNPNLSGGIMFPDLAKKSAGYMALRAKSEPLVEVIQLKGNSECSNSSTSAYGSNDEECDYRPNKGRLACDPQRPTPNCLPICKTIISGFGNICVQPNDFVRGALRKGIESQKNKGVNPYKFGFVGSTDTHNGAAGATDNWIGTEEPAAWTEGGLAVIWSEQNRRETLFDNMRKKETYATSGSRPILRFFAGWSLDRITHSDPEWVSKAYQGGVPMGGTLNNAPPGRASPRFVISAFMDPGTERHPGTPLERAQIVKVWTSGNKSHEKVFHVAGSSSVTTPAEALNLDTCRPTTTGLSNMFTTWTDPEFDPHQQASYYVRLIEKPSCTRDTYLLNASLAKLGLNCRSAQLNKEQALACKARSTTRNRAWSSPIWYEPS